MICQYGCGREAKYPPKKGMTKWCRENHYNKCPAQIEIKTKKALESGKLHGRVPWNKGTKGLQTAWNKGRKWSNKTKIKMSQSSKLTIPQIKKRYPLFYKIEELQYSPDKPDEIQVHCKNHKCPNSKEQGGWFTPTHGQLYERIRQLEKNYGNGGSYLYCSDECKKTCPLYYIFDDPFKVKKELYTPSEYKIWRDTVIKNDNYECQKCGSLNDLDVHHIYPEKTHPLLALDCMNGITLCRRCHIEIGHSKDGNCSLYSLKQICQPKLGENETEA